MVTPTNERVGHGEAERAMPTGARAHAEGVVGGWREVMKPSFSEDVFTPLRATFAEKNGKCGVADVRLLPTSSY